MQPLVWGVISTARIGWQRVIPAMQSSALCDVHAIASRNTSQAQAAAAELGIAVAHGSYEALLSDPDVEAVYNPLPNHLHADWTIAAMRAGKHVLCEKPMTCNSDEILPIIKARDECGVYVEEAFMVRDHLQWQVVRELIDGGRIGTVRDVQMSYSHFSQDPDDIRFSVEAGGGSLMDVGCYCVAMMRFIFNGEPQRVMAATRSPSADAVDHVTTAMLEFEQGHGSFFCSIRASRSQLVQIVGDAGWIRLEVPFAHPDTLSTRILIGENVTPGTDPVETLTLPPQNQYQLQAERFVRQIRNSERSRWPLEDSLANMRVIDAIKQSGAEGRWWVV